MTNLDRCRAEAVAWPFVSPDAFRHAAPVLRRDILLPSMRLRLQQLGLRREQELTQWAWSDKNSLFKHLQHHARRLLYNNGHCMRLCPDHESPGQEILNWRWYSLTLPPLLFASAAMPPGVPASHWIQILDPTLIPRGPVAHLHLHLGAVYPFELVWSHMAATVRFDGIQTWPAGMHDAREWKGWLIRAFLARRVLAAHVYHRSPLGKCDQCSVCVLQNPDSADVARAMREISIGRQQDHDAFQEARLAHFARTVRFRRRPLRDISDIGYNDPLGGEGLLAEAGLMAASFAYLERQGQAIPSDPLYERLWTQYLRVRCMFYRHLVADPAEVGLSTFSRRYNCIDEYVGSDFDTFAPALALDEPELDLRAVEVRSGPPRDASICRAKAANIRTIAKKSKKEIGWVFHFIRDRGLNDEWPRYASIYRSHGRAASVLGRCLETWPELLRDIRGLDIASEELKGPLWLAIPSLHKLRRISIRSARQKPGLQPLRLTLHVGEDFRHIASGLRAVHEPFAWKLIERGDRLGHALALGIDATQWCQQNPHILQPRLERIFDLAWMLDLISSSDWPAVDGSNVHRLQQDLRVRLLEWTGEEYSWEIGIELYNLLGKPDALAQIGYPLLGVPEPSSGSKSLRLLWCLLYARSRGQYADEIVEISTEPEAELLSHIQRNIADLLSRWQVTIEINPSSNLLIGDLQQPLNQPMFQLRPVGQDVSHALPIAISADDPITFATRLADEYAYAWAGMVVAGNVSPTYARQWLDEAVETAWRSRFTAPISRHVS